MSIDRIQESLAKLMAYTERSKDALSDVSVISPDTKSLSEPAKGTLLDVLSSIMDISDGGMTSTQMVKKFKEFNAKSSDGQLLSDKVLIYVDGNDFQPENLMSSIVGSSSKGLSLIQVDTIRVTPAGRDVSAVSAMLNMIPTIELSRCVPYLTIDVQTGRSPISSDGRLQGLTLSRFLAGSFNTTTSPGDQRLAASLQGSSALIDDVGELMGVDVTVAGMELFTSPQTLTNPDPSIDALRAGPALDKFRPFMSIEKFSIEITPQVGFFAYRTADLELVLHDRSRLSEIADFIKPDLYGTTELLIEYGWSHPDKTGDNVFGLLLNSMRAKEKYGIVNSSFTMGKSGDVKIKLKLFTRGMTDMQTVRIGDRGQAVEAVRAVRNLQKSIASIRSKLSLTNDKGNREVRGEQQLFANAEDIGSALILSGESRSTLRRFINGAAKSNNGDINDLAKALIELYGKDGRGGQKIADLNKNVAKTISDQISLFKKATKQSDPFLFTGREKLAKIKSFKSSDTRAGYVSFARLMASFIGAPLAAKNEYADVQLIFYPFNAKAGLCSNHSIAEFAIRIDELEQGLNSVARSRGLQLPLRDFIQYVANNYIDDMANPAYGLSNFYTTRIDNKTGVRTSPSSKLKNLDSTKLFDHVQARLLSIGSQDGTFKMPQLDVIIETVPVAAVESSESRQRNKLQTILKIHFFDRCATAYESLGSLLLASREEDLRTIGELANNVANDHSAVYNEFLSKAKNSDVVRSLLEKVNVRQTKTPTGVFNVKFDIEKLRTFIRQNVPTIVYGSSNTGIKDASFSTIQSPLLSTIHMLRAGEAGPLAPDGLTKSNLPLRTLPAKASMTTVGCPFIQYMQQFFIDFNTNTTIDNIYGVNKLSHEIAAGKFETKIDFVPLDAYGRYESLPNQVGAILQHLEVIQDSKKK